MVTGSLGSLAGINILSTPERSRTKMLGAKRRIELLPTTALLRLDAHTQATTKEQISGGVRTQAQHDSEHAPLNQPQDRAVRLTVD